MIQIADVRYRIDDVTYQFPPQNSVYKQFIHNARPGVETMDVRIRLGHGKLPDPERLPLIFQTGRAWNMYKRGEAECMIFRSPTMMRAAWAATFSPDGRTVDVIAVEQNAVCLYPPLSSPLDQMILMKALAGQHGVLIHATAAEIEGRGCVFAGVSGQGKSTLARLIEESGCGKVLSDERPVLRSTRQGLRVFGSPWHSAARCALPDDAAFDFLFFINHGKKDVIGPCSSQQALERFFPLVSIPWYDAERIPAYLDFCGRVVSDVPAYTLAFTPGPGVVERICSFVRG